MAVSYVSGGRGGNSIGAMPTHAIGDLLLLVYRSMASAPTVPTAGGTVPVWNTIAQRGQTVPYTLYWLLAWARATATNHTSGSWRVDSTNTGCACISLRAAATKSPVIGAVATAFNDTMVQVPTYPALTPTVMDSTSLGVRALAINATAGLSANAGWQSPGFTFRVADDGTGSFEQAGFYTTSATLSGPISAFTGTTPSANSFMQDSATLEVVEGSAVNKLVTVV